MEELRGHVELTAGRSNAIRSDLEEQMAKLLYSEAQDDLRALDDKIAKVQQTLDLLNEKRVPKAERMNRFQVATAPHRHVPAETWSNIFVHCMDGVEAIIPPDQHCMPYTLGMVCSRWRTISHAEHRLWNRIYLSPSASLEAFQLILPLIGTSSIDIRVSNKDFDTTSTLLGIFARYSHRIRALKFVLHHKLQENFALAGISYPFTVLESLNISILQYHEAINPGIALALTSFFASGNLSDVRLIAHSCDHSLITSELISLPWDRLKKLTIGCGLSISFLSLLNILQSCTSLVTLSVVILDRAPPQNLSSTVILKSLHFFSIFIMGDEIIGLGEFLDHLTCPSLLNLKILPDN